MIKAAASGFKNSGLTRLTDILTDEHIVRAVLALEERYRAMDKITQVSESRARDIYNADVIDAYEVASVDDLKKARTAGVILGGAGGVIACHKIENVTVRELGQSGLKISFMDLEKDKNLLADAVGADIVAQIQEAYEACGADAERLADFFLGGLDEIRQDFMLDEYHLDEEAFASLGGIDGAEPERIIQAIDGLGARLAVHTMFMSRLLMSNLWKHAESNDGFLQDCSVAVLTKLSQIPQKDGVRMSEKDFWVTASMQQALTRYDMPTQSTDSADRVKDVTVRYYVTTSEDADLTHFVLHSERYNGFLRAVMSGKDALRLSGLSMQDHGHLAAVCFNQQTGLRVPQNRLVSFLSVAADVGMLPSAIMRTSLKKCRAVLDAETHTPATLAKAKQANEVLDYLARLLAETKERNMYASDLLTDRSFFHKLVHGRNEEDFIGMSKEDFRTLDKYYRYMTEVLRRTECGADIALMAGGVTKQMGAPRSTGFNDDASKDYKKHVWLWSNLLDSVSCVTDFDVVEKNKIPHFSEIVEIRLSLMEEHQNKGRRLSDGRATDIYYAGLEGCLAAIGTRVDKADEDDSFNFTADKQAYVDEILKCMRRFEAGMGALPADAGEPWREVTEWHQKLGMRMATLPVAISEYIQERVTPLSVCAARNHWSHNDAEAVKEKVNTWLVSKSHTLIQDAFEKMGGKRGEKGVEEGLVHLLAFSRALEDLVACHCLHLSLHQDVLAEKDFFDAVEGQLNMLFKSGSKVRVADASVVTENAIRMLQEMSRGPDIEEGTGITF